MHDLRDRFVHPRATSLSALPAYLGEYAHERRSTAERCCYVNAGGREAAKGASTLLEAQGSEQPEEAEWVATWAPVTRRTLPDAAAPSAEMATNAFSPAPSVRRLGQRAEGAA